MIDNKSIRSLLPTLNRWELLLVVVSLGVSLFITVNMGEKTYDDAFITFRYAKNLVLGEGFVYNSGDAVLGTTTPPF